MSKMYIHLFHGRKSVNQQMDDWGADGPTFGPYDSIRGTYVSSIVCSNDNRSDMFAYSDDCLYYDGMYYGDFNISTDVLGPNYPEIEKMQEADEM